MSNKNSKDDSDILKNVKITKNLFCDNSHLLFPKEINGKKYLFCRKCNEYYQSEVEMIIRSEIKSNGRGNDIAIFDSVSAPIDATETKFKCPKCGNNRAYTWDRQIGYADEDPHVFTRCTKCGFTEKNVFQL